MFLIVIFLDKFEIKTRGSGGRTSSLHVKKSEYQAPIPFSHAFIRKPISPSEFKRFGHF